MAIKLVKTEWGAYDAEYRREQICEYMVDSPDDFANLPKAAPGSVAVAPNGDVMVANASGEWVKFGG